jgi:hypothetical protein
MHQKQILELLGVDAVLLPIPKGIKFPKLRGWQKTTFADTQDATYQQKLKTHGNTGVLLGKPSQNLCSIDFDDDDALEYFLQLNPNLKSSLRTCGKRGANIWVILKGEYPPTYHFKNADGDPAGEWRSDGGQTIISGTHPEGNQYQILVENKPQNIAFVDINWGDLSPSKTNPPRTKCHIDDINDTKHINHIDDTEIQIKQKNRKKQEKLNLSDRIKRAETAQRKLKKNKDLKALYNNYIKNKFTPRQGERNAQLVSMVTFLFRAVGEKRVLEISAVYHQINQDTFQDTLEQHQGEAKSHLKATKERWLSKLPEETRKAFDDLPQRQSEAFRICLSLAEHECEKCPEGEFFLSCAELGKRLGIDMKQAHRILLQLEAEGIIKITHKGTRRTKKTKGLANRYKWLLPLSKIEQD